MLGLLAAAALAGSAAAAAEGQPSRARALEVEETVRLTIPPGAGEVRLWIPKLAENGLQKVELVAVDSPWPHRVTRETTFGNQLLFLESKPASPGPVELRLRYRVDRREQKAPRQEKVLPPDLQPRGLVVINDEVRKIARETTMGIGEPLEKARAIYHYVFSRMSYDKTGQGWGRGDVVYACKVGKGNCTDFHSLFAALAMSEGIPVRFQMGYSVPRAAQGELGSGYHCWAEFHVAGRGWIPVDISEAWKRPAMAAYYFGRLDSDRVLVSSGRELELSPPQKGAPLNYLARPYAEVDGRPLLELEFSRSYKDRS